MSVNSYLKDLASDLVLSTDEKESISTSIDTIKNRLGLYFTTDVEEKKVFGSYDRGTILPRKDDENSDVDLMVVFKNPYEYKPQTFLKKLKNFSIIGLKKTKKHCLLKLNFQTKKMLKNVKKKKVNYY